LKNHAGLADPSATKFDARGITETIERALASAGLNAQSGLTRGILDTINQSLTTAGLMHPGASPRGMAAGNQLAAALVLLPLLPVLPPLSTPTPLVIANLVALAILASGVAFLLYFRLIADVGATRALTVTYLIPLFGVLWGWIFLGETLPAAALAGGALILAGTVLVTRG